MRGQGLGLLERMRGDDEGRAVGLHLAQQVVDVQPSVWVEPRRTVVLAKLSIPSRAASPATGAGWA